MEAKHSKSHAFQRWTEQNNEALLKVFAHVVQILSGFRHYLKASILAGLFSSSSQSQPT
jgi:hypothetical protein